MFFTLTDAPGAGMGAVKENLLEQQVSEEQQSHRENGPKARKMNKTERKHKRRFIQLILTESSNFEGEKMLCQIFTINQAEGTLLAS